MTERKITKELSEDIIFVDRIFDQLDKMLNEAQTQQQKKDIKWLGHIIAEAFAEAGVK